MRVVSSSYFSAKLKLFGVELSLRLDVTLGRTQLVSNGKLFSFLRFAKYNQRRFMPGKDRSDSGRILGGLAAWMRIG
jgi:hypothetical protein